MEEKKQEFNTKYAYRYSDDGLTKLEVWIYDENVRSGRQGYFCLGCNKELIAYKRDIERMDFHFRHDPKYAKTGDKCTYSKETELHKMAKEVLSTLKYITVPALYKYPPGGQGQAMFIAKKKRIHATSVRNEIAIFEDELGKIGWDRWDAERYGKKNKAIRADVVFFDREGQPILIIEIAHSHKVDRAKMEKLYFFGIDTVQVAIPNIHVSEMGTLFDNSQHTEWLYNNEIEKTTYVEPTIGTGSEIPEDDGRKREIASYGESFQCRQAAIKQLIRQFTKHLQSDEFEASRGYFTSEIERVQGNIRREKGALEELREGIRRRVQKLVQREFESQERSLEQTNRELDARYTNKRGVIETKAKRIEDLYDYLQGRMEETDAKSRRLYREEGNIRQEEKGLEESIGKLRDSIDRKRTEIFHKIGVLRKGTEGFIEHFETETRERIAKEEGEYARRIRIKEEDFERELREQENSIESKLREEERKLASELAREEGELVKRLGREEIQISVGTGNALKGNAPGISTLDEGIRIKQLTIAIAIIQCDFKRLRRLKELFDQGAYKNWRDKND